MTGNYIGAARVELLLEQYFPKELQENVLQCVNHLDNGLNSLQEIRCRVHKPLFLRCAQGKEIQAIDNVSSKQMRYMVNRISQGSVYAWEEEFRRGYLTLPGGCRVGLTGKAVLEQGQIHTLTHINGLNFRIARAVSGAADILMPLLYEGDHIRNCLLVSPPGGGKTTMLRDMVRQLSDGVTVLGKPGYTVAVIDERSEIAGCIQGIPQMDVGCRTDVLDGCSKSEGIRMMIRAMAPQIIAVDEIGTEADVQALEEASESGVAVFATAHGISIEGLYRHPVLYKLVKGGYFTLIVFLHWHLGQVISEIYLRAGGGGYEAVRYYSDDWGR